MRRVAPSVSASWRPICAISDTGRNAAIASKVSNGKTAGSIAPRCISSAPAITTARPPRPVKISSRLPCKRQLAVERQAQLHMALRQRVERARAILLLLEGDDLAEALHRIDREGAELAGRFARVGAEPVDLAAQQERAQPDRSQERQQRQRQPRRFEAQPHQHHARHQDGDEGGRDGVGEEILDQLDVMGGERHQIAGASPHQIGRRQLIELAEHVDPHVRQQAERHVVGDPGFQPVQQAGQRRHHRERPQPVAIRLAVLQVQHHQARSGCRRR